MKTAKGLARWTEFLLGYSLFVILWGTWVRHSRSGDGCRDTWPLCEGSVLPQFQNLPQVIEWFHRATSGLFGLVVLGIAFAAWRLAIADPKNVLQKKAKFISVLLVFVTVLEGLIGAALVKFGLVTDNDSFLRVFVMGLHQVNTLLLLAIIVWLLATLKGVQLSNRVSGLQAIALALWVGTAFLGAFASLANQLYPEFSLSEGLAPDFDSGSPWLIRVRIFHPSLAIVSTLLAMPLATLALKGMIIVSLSLGAINVLVHDAVALKLLHLLAVDITWCLLIQQIFFLKVDRAQDKTPASSC